MKNLLNFRSKRDIALLTCVLLLIVITTFGARGEATDAQRAVLSALAKGDVQPWPGLTPEQPAYLLKKADDYLAEFQAHHLPHGGAADVWWTDETRTTVHLYDTLGDSACWTGHYLAALAFRYAVTKDPQTLTAIQKTLDWYDLLTRVSGVEGYLARYAGPADDPAYERYYTPYKSGHFRGAPPFENLIWLGDSSRDSYDGTRLGLVSVWTLVDDAAVRTRAANLLERILDNLIANDWWIKDNQGHATRPTPTFEITYVQAALRINPEKYKDLQPLYEDSFQALSQMSPRQIDKYRREYFAYNLDCSRLLTLNLLEKDPLKKKVYEKLAQNLFEGSIDHVNAWFAALYAVSTHDITNATVQAILLGQLLDFPGPPNARRGTDLTNDPSIEKRDETYSLYALDIRKREPDTFIWQRSPCVLKGGTPNVTYHWGGIDYFLPYWAGRYAGIIPAEQEPKNAPTTSSAEEKIPTLGGNASTDAKRFHFAILGDRTGGAELEWPLFDRAVDELNFLRPDFVLTVGDQIQGYVTEEEVMKQQWDEYKQHANRLQMPLYLLPGNHDVSNPRMLAWWKENLGRRYYAWEHKNCLFLVLNIMEHWEMNASSLGEEQVRFALDTLKQHPDVRHTFVFLHMPLWRDPARTDWQAIEAALAGRPHTVFAGHTHTMSYEERNGGKYIVLAVTRGMAPNWSNDTIHELGQFAHYTWVTVDNNDVQVAHIEPGSAMWPADVAPKSFQDALMSLIKIDGVQPNPFADNKMKTGFSAMIDNKLPKPVQIMFEVTPLSADSWQVAEGDMPRTLTLNPGDQQTVECQFVTPIDRVVPAPRLRTVIQYDGKPLRAIERNFPLYPEKALRSIPAWTVVGPFQAGTIPTTLPDNPKDALPLVFKERGPEQGFDPDKTYSENGQTLSWHEVETRDGFLDLMHLVETPVNVLAYAVCGIQSPSDKTYYASFRADDYARIAVNGKWLENDRLYRTRSDATYIALPLHAGWNSIMVVCVNVGGGWSFRMLPADPDNELTFSSSPK